MRRNNNQLSFLILLILGMTLHSCIDKSNNDTSDYYNNIVKEWTGKTIEIPNSYEYQIGNTIVDYDFYDSDFKIITYIDSVGCSSCQMKLFEWSNLIDEFKSLRPDETVNFLMIFNSKDVRYLKKQIEANEFILPVTFDEQNLFSNLNDIPADQSCHTFLLDGSNRVLAIGNPTINPKIKELYTRIISKENFRSAHNDYVQSKPNLYVTPASINVGILSPSETFSTIVDVINQENKPVSIEDVITSCDCIKVNFHVKSLSPQGLCQMEVTITPLNVSPGNYMQYIYIFIDGFDKPKTVSIYGFVK